MEPSLVTGIENALKLKSQDDLQNALKFLSILSAKENGKKLFTNNEEVLTVTTNAFLQDRDELSNLALVVLFNCCLSSKSLVSLSKNIPFVQKIFSICLTRSTPQYSAIQLISGSFFFFFLNKILIFFFLLLLLLIAMIEHFNEDSLNICVDQNFINELCEFFSKTDLPLLTPIVKILSFLSFSSMVKETILTYGPSVWKKLLELISTTNKNSIRYSLLLLAQLYPSINFNDRGLVLALETTKLLSSTDVEIVQASSILLSQILAQGNILLDYDDIVSMLIPLLRYILFYFIFINSTTFLIGVMIMELFEVLVNHLLIFHCLNQEQNLFLVYFLSFFSFNFKLKKEIKPVNQ